MPEIEQYMGLRMVMEFIANLGKKKVGLAYSMFIQTEGL